MATAACMTQGGVYSRSTPLKFSAAGCATQAGVISTTGRIAWAGSSEKRKQVNWLPQANVAVVDANGRMTQVWYKFFQEIANQRLGGIDAPTVPEVLNTTAAVQDQVVSVQSSVQSVNSQVATITDTVNTQTQVAQDNNLAGSAQLSKLPSYKQQQIGRGDDL